MTVVNFPGNKTADARLDEGIRKIRLAIADVMRRARRGDISAIAICWVNKEDTTQHRWECPFEQPLLMGAISYMQHDFASAMIAAAEDDPEPDTSGHA